MFKISIYGFIVVSLLGSLFHFLYDYVPIFIFPMNESIFEHTKLIIFPFLFYYISLLFFKIENKKELFPYFVTGIFVGVISVIVLYYTYSGFIGKNVDWVNIVIYFISVIISFICIYKKKTLFNFKNSVLGLLILLILVTIFSYITPDIAFFLEN